MTEKDPSETWMWERARSMLDQADKLQRTFFAPARPGTRAPSWAPPADVFETGTEVWVVVTLPGVAPETVQVEVFQNDVTICGLRAQPPAFRAATVHRLEIPHGRFERRVTLPPGHYELAHQELVLGCLFLGLTKRS
ncbi:MAG TPA: Hsp20/alpha crystallin family protein [Planctomycetota bacterium]